MRSPAGRWPAFTPAARQLGAGAVFAFPLIVGAIRAGVLGLYRGAAGPLPDGQLGDLLILADAATVMLLGSAEGYTENGDGAGLDGQAPDLALHRAEIDQATGMLTVQLGVPVGGGVRPAPGLRLFSGPAARGRGRRHRRPAAAAAPGPGSGRRPVRYPAAQARFPAAPPLAFLPPARG